VQIDILIFHGLYHETIVICVETFTSTTIGRKRLFWCGDEQN